MLIAENATLALLHQVIRALFGWDDDHLHVFSAGRRHYADPFHGLEETVPEYLMRLHQAIPHPECLTGRGDNPIEYYDPDYPVDAVPFDAARPSTNCCTSRHSAPAWRIRVMWSRDEESTVDVADAPALWRILVTERQGRALPPAVAIDTFRCLHEAGQPEPFDSALFVDGLAVAAYQCPRADRHRGDGDPR